MNGRHAEALTRFRRALIEDPQRIVTWIDYGYEALALSRTSAAHEAFANALDLDPSNIRALEMFVDTATKMGIPREIIKRKIGNAVADLPAHPQRALDLLDFSIPFGVKQTAPATLPVRVSKAAELLRLNLNPDFTEEAFETDLSSVEARDVFIRFTTLRGRHSAAEKLLSRTPADRLPTDSIRRSMKRMTSQGKYPQAKMLASYLLKANPKDAMAKRRWEQLERDYRESQAGVEKTSLLATGFPFPAAKSNTVHASTSTVLYLLHNSLPYSSAGYATRSHGLISQIRQSGIDIAGVTRPGYPFDRPEAKLADSEVPSWMDIEGVPYHRLSTSAEILPKSPLVPYVYEYAERLENLGRERKAGLIHAASNHWNGLAAVTAARRLGIPSVYEVRGLWEITRISREPEWKGTLDYEFMAAMESEAAKGATHVIAITNALKQEMISRGVPAEKIDIVPNGVDTTRFLPSEPDSILKDSLGLSGKTVVGYIGSILDYEGIDTLLDAARILKGERDDFCVLIVGDGAYLNNAVTRAEVLGVEDVVLFIGRVPHSEVEKYYSIVDIAPIPRHSRPVTEMVSPLKPFEAMAMGKVVVGADVEAIKEIIIPGVNGLLFEKDSASDLAQVLSTLLTDNSLVSSIGRSARNWVVAERDWKHLALRVSDIYEKLL